MGVESYIRVDDFGLENTWDSVASAASEMCQAQS